MTSLDKLAIQGVRAYSPDEEQIIQFLHPLTIIVGANGSGKTTIIEALRFATTGTAPDTSERGKNFVHDPRVSGLSMVKGKLKLSFTSTSRKKIVAVKLFQLTQKPGGKREYKQLDSVLKTKDASGNELTLSHKCSDMEKLVPSLLGVSKPILDLVIFCHQEESLWPMSDSKSLKERFDEIFAATRYSAALARIKKLRSEKATELQQMQGEVGILEANLSHARKLQDERENLLAQIVGRKEEIKEIDAELSEIEAARQAQLAKREGAADLQREIERAEQARNMLTQQKDQTRTRIGPRLFEESVEQLQKYQQEWQQTMKAKGEEKKADEARLSEKRARAQELQRQREDVMRRVGQIEAQEQAHNAKRADAQRQLAALAAKYSIDTSELPSIAADPSGFARFQAFVTRLSEERAKKKAALQRFLSESESVDALWQRQMADSRAKEGELSGLLEGKRSQITSSTQRDQQLQRDLQRIEQAMGGQADLAQKLAEAQRQSKDLSEDAVQRERGDEIQRLESQLATNQQQLSVMSKRMGTLQADADALAKVQLRRQQLDTLKSRLRTLLAPIESKLLLTLSLVSLPEAPSELSAQLQQKQRGVRSDREEAERTLTRAREQASTLDGSLRAAKQSLDQNRHRMDALMAQIRAGCDDEAEVERVCGLLGNEAVSAADKIQALRESIDRSQQKLRELRNTRDTNEAAINVLNFYLSEAERSHQCPVCDRNFPAGESDRYLQLIRDKQDSAVQAGRANMSDAGKQRLAQLQQRLDYRVRVLPACEEFLNLRYEAIPQGETQAKQLQTQLALQQQEVRTLETKVSSKRTEEESLRDLSTETDQAARLHAEIVETTKIIDTESKSLSGGAEAGSLESLRQEYAAEQRTSQTLMSRLSNLRNAETVHQNKLKEAQTRVSQLMERSVSLQRQQAERERAVAERTELAVKVESLRAEMQELEVKIKAIREERARKETERQGVRAQQQRNEQQLRQDSDQLEREAGGFKILSDELATFAQNETERTRLRDALKGQSTSFDSLNVDIAALEARIAEHTKTLASNEDLFRAVQDNLEYRRLLEQVQLKANEIKEMRKKIAAVGDLSLVTQELQRLEQQRGQRQSRKDTLRGAIQAEEQRVREVDIDLQSDKYKDIDARFRQMNIKFETTKMANQDLEKFYRALDRALMEFHSMKMQEINAVLTDLWRLTYKGTDIDEILIKTDVNEEKSESGAASRRQYNYRVVMRQGDTELDMRGRCSAGQKVLASMLIRLALAETFCADCGILALDEPTTNLDSKNSRALAQALSEIIEKRRRQLNFQLIIITHDEEFVDLLGKREVAEYYYRVSKDRNGYSVIQKQPMSED